MLSLLIYLVLLFNNFILINSYALQTGCRQLYFGQSSLDTITFGVVRTSHDAKYVIISQVTGPLATSSIAVPTTSPTSTPVSLIWTSINGNSLGSTDPTFVSSDPLNLQTLTPSGDKYYCTAMSNDGYVVFTGTKYGRTAVGFLSNNVYNWKYLKNTTSSTASGDGIKTCEIGQKNNVYYIIYQITNKIYLSVNSGKTFTSASTPDLSDGSKFTTDNARSVNSPSNAPIATNKNFYNYIIVTMSKDASTFAYAANNNPSTNTGISPIYYARPTNLVNASSINWKKSSYNWRSTQDGCAVSYSNNWCNLNILDISLSNNGQYGILTCEACQSSISTSDYGVTWTSVDNNNQISGWQTSTGLSECKSLSNCYGMYSHNYDSGNNNNGNNNAFCWNSITSFPVQPIATCYTTNNIPGSPSFWTSNHLSGDGTTFYSISNALATSENSIKPLHYSGWFPANNIIGCQTTATTQPPTGQPTGQPSSRPSGPTGKPTGRPTRQPSSQPTRQPSRQPTRRPTGQPTSQPSIQPTRKPTGQPSRQPTRQPTGQPTRRPTGQPTRQPTRQPTGQPSGKPSSQPSGQPSSQPTYLDNCNHMPGTYSVQVYFNSHATVYCYPCPAGTYSSTVPQISGPAICAPCSAGKFAPGFSAYCTDCPAGYYSSSGQGTCQPCLAGTFGNSTGLNNCYDCPTGKYSYPFASKCLNCPAGYYSNNGQTCEICPSGTYSSIGASVCISCNSTTLYSSPGASSCDTC
jgi:hypothetical protein